MRQLIARIDDRLHARLKARAKAEGRSLNALVVELLENGLAANNERERVRARMRGLGLLVTLPRPTRPPLSLDEAIELTRGWGTAVSEALAADRARR